MFWLYRGQYSNPMQLLPSRPVNQQYLHGIVHVILFYTSTYTAVLSEFQELHEATVNRSNDSNTKVTCNWKDILGMRKVRFSDSSV